MYALIKIKLNDKANIFDASLINQYIKDWIYDMIKNNSTIREFIQDYTIEVKL